MKQVARSYEKKPYSYWKKTHREIFDHGARATKERSLATARSEAAKLLTSLDLPSLKSASMDGLAVAERMVWQMSMEASLTPAIAEARGLPDALDVALRASHLQLEGHFMESLAAIPAAEGGHYAREPCPLLRHALCLSAEEDYARAREHAERLREETRDLGDRVMLAYLFPDAGWAASELRAELDDTTKVKTRRDGKVSWLLSATDDADVVRRWVEAEGPFVLSRFAIELVCVLDPKDSIPLFTDAIAKLLVKPKYGPLHKTPPRLVAQGLGAIATKEAAAALAPYASNAILGPQVLAWFHAHPAYGALLKGQVKGGSKLAVTAARVLNERAAEPRAAAAKASELPTVLRDRPWRRPPSAAGASVALTMRGLDRERVHLVRRPSRNIEQEPTRDMTSAELSAWRKSLAAKDSWVCCDYDHFNDRRTKRHEYLRVPDKEGLAAWNGGGKVTLAGGELAWVERHGMKTLPGFLARDWIKWLAWEGNEETFEAVRSLISPRVAPSIARVAARRKRYRRDAIAWLLAHTEVAAYGLIPDALGEAKEPRDDAEAALLFLVSQGRSAIVRKVAKAYGKEAERAVLALLEHDRLLLGATPPKRPPFLHVEELPQVLLANKKRALGDDAMNALVEMLQITGVDDPYPGVALIRAACDVGTLGELALELTEQWVIGDAPGRHEWMLLSTLHFPSEKAIRRVAELAREWARKNQAKALRACVTLSLDGSDLALMHLAHIAETTRFAKLKEDAAELLKDAALQRGLTEDELGDRTVPDAGLAADGTITLTLGNQREIVVSVDASLAPIVRERRQDKRLGPPQKTLPRPQKTDDLALAKVARETFDTFRKDLAAIGQRQVRRLERAMATERSWLAHDFEARIASHPLLRTIARALVWEVVGKGGTCFRITEDGTYANVKDQPFKLAARAQVRLAHPARTHDLKAWSEIFGDYEIIQPFEQLGRATHLLSSKERKSKALTRAAAIEVPARKLLGMMESRGWRRDDKGYVTAWLRSFDGCVVRWPIKPGISMESLSHRGGADVVTTESLTVSTSEGTSAELGALDAVAFSEVMRDVEAARNLTP